MNSKGLAVWSLGESLLVDDKEGKQFIVKDIVNLQAKKQLQLFLIETEELLERIFESSKDVPMMVLGGSMKIIKTNAAFLSLFELQEAPPENGRLSEIAHPFWQSAEIKKVVSAIIISDTPLKHREFVLRTRSGKDKTIKIDSRIIEGQRGAGRKIFLLIEEVTTPQTAG